MFFGQNKILMFMLYNENYFIVDKKRKILFYFIID